jgi:hypothetical protein
MLTDAGKTLAEATLARLNALRGKQDADGTRMLFQEQATRDLIYGQLNAQRDATLKGIVAALMVAHTDESACRHQAEQTPRFREEMNKEARLNANDLHAAKIAIEILERALA